MHRHLSIIIVITAEVIIPPECVVFDVQSYDEAETTKAMGRDSCHLYF